MLLDVFSDLTANMRLVGRPAELAAVAGAVNDLRSGRGGVVVTRGEPGIGKSSLLSAMAAQAERAGLRVCAGAAERLESRLPFSAIGACLGLSRSSPDARLAAVARMIGGETEQFISRPNL